MRFRGAQLTLQMDRNIAQEASTDKLVVGFSAFLNDDCQAELGLKSVP